MKREEEDVANQKLKKKTEKPAVDLENTQPIETLVVIDDKISVKTEVKGSKSLDIFL